MTSVLKYPIENGRRSVAPTSTIRRRSGLIIRVLPNSYHAYVRLAWQRGDGLLD